MNPQIDSIEVISENGIKYNGLGFGQIRHGFGKEYKDNILISEGFWQRNKKDGKMIEYNENERVIFEGHYVNSLRHGNGTETLFDLSGTLVVQTYNGNWSNGYKHGSGTLTIMSDNKVYMYQGTWLNNCRCGTFDYVIVGENNNTRYTIVYQLAEEHTVIDNGSLLHRIDDSSSPVLIHTCDISPIKEKSA